jgi:23S rRNA pseudouridine1911/1915/1917 synthase
VITLVVDESGIRIDAWLAKKLGVSRSRITACIQQNMVLLNQSPVKSSCLIQEGDIISYEETLLPVIKEILAENIPLRIVYEDENLLIIDKPSGLLTHPSIHQCSGTLVNAAMFYSQELSDVAGKERLGIVHRLDKETSGLIVVARNNKAHHYMTELFSSRKITKTYIAIVEGHFPNQHARITIPIDKFPEKSCMKVSSKGKQAITEVSLMNYLSSQSLLTVNIFTGRTHQIRVHLAHLGYPVCGDTIYGSMLTPCKRMMLHSWKLSFVLPGETEEREFIADLPPEFPELIEKLS